MKNNFKIAVPKSGGLQFKGIWRVQLFENGVQVFDHEQDNIIVDNAIVHMAHGYGPADFDMLHVGTAPFPSTPTTAQIALDQDYYPAGYSTTHTQIDVPAGTFSFQKKASLPAGTFTANTTLTEAGLFTSDSSPVMLNRILFTPSIQITPLQAAFITTTIQIRRV